MKSYKLSIPLLALLLQSTFANTYVWEDYDDFSESSLDTSKWGVITFNGGIEPYHQNGSLMLSSNAQDLNAIPQNDAEWDAFVADLKQWGDPEVFAYIKDSSIRGVQASFSMPNGSADGTFVDLSFYEVDSSGQEATMTGIGIGLSQENGITKIKIETEGVVFNADPIAANISQTYTFSIINIGDTCEIFLDGVKVGEISLVNFQPNLISLSAYNENQQGYNIETDNVRVLRRSTGSPSIKVAPLALGAFRDKVYLQGQNGPVEIDGASEINFDLQLIGQPTVSAATMTVDSVTYDLTSFQAPTAFRTNYGYSSFDDELFDVESSSESDWNQYINGKTFNFNITVDGITYSYAHNLPPESSLPSTPNTSFAESSGWKTDSDGYAYQEARAGNSLTLTWDTFSLASSDDFITVSVEELVGDNEIEVMGSTSLPVTATSYEFPSNLFESGKKYTLYVEFHKVLESENPTGFEHQSGTNTSQSLLITTARAVTAVDVVIVDTTPVTVVSDPNGQAVVVQVGNEYQWNSTLDGVTLWSVSASERDAKWSPLTAKFSGGNLLYGFEFKDDVADTGNNKVTYQIDENGYIKSLENDGGYQYYHVVSVENGIIATLEGDEQGVVDDGVNVADQWFFTARAAAEEYYYSKVNPSIKVAPLDVPIVRTSHYQASNDGTYVLGGKILTDGGYTVLESGILISEDLSFQGSSKRIPTILPRTKIDFYISVNDLKHGTTYYYRAYARNLVGETQGVRRRLKTPEKIEPNSWSSGTVSLGNGWDSSDWFGQFRKFQGTTWIHHTQLGWLYSVDSQGGGVWLWDREKGWCWTQKGVWPYLYQSRIGGWIYFLQQQKGRKIFYDYQNKSYFNLP